MGKSITPKYRIELWENRRTTWFPCSIQMCWFVKNYGPVTNKNLERWIEKYNQSYQPGGVNWHVSERTGIVHYCHTAKIVEQKTGEVVAEYHAPAFMIM